MVAHAFVSRLAERRRVSIGWLAWGAIGVTAAILCSLGEEPPRSRMEAQPACASAPEARALSDPLPPDPVRRAAPHCKCAPIHAPVAVSRRRHE